MNIEKRQIMSNAMSNGATPDRSGLPAAEGFSAGLASLRGLAASLVVVYHSLLIFQVGPLAQPHRTPPTLDDPWQFLLQLQVMIFNGPNAVVLFFVLSGTVLSMSLARSDVSAASMHRYYVRRAFRILPLLSVTAAIAAAAHLTLFPSSEMRTGTAWMNEYYRHDPNAVEVALNAIGWSNSLNSPAWTIRVEIIASILFPLLYILVPRAGSLLLRLTQACIVALGLIGLAYLEIDGAKTHMFLFAFYIGALIPTLGREIVGAISPNAVQSFVLIVCAVAVAAVFQRFWRPWIHVEPARSILVACAMAVPVVLIYSGFARRALAWRPLLVLGDISYSMYLLHFGILFALARVVDVWLPDSLTPGQAIALNLAVALAGLVIVIPVSWLMWRYVEMPFQTLGKRLGTRRSKAA